MRRHRKQRSLEDTHIHRRAPPGASPGSILVDPSAKRGRVQVIAYGPDGSVERNLTDLHDVAGFLKSYPVTWINVDGLGDAALIEKLGQIFHLHRLALEDVVNVHQRAKVDEYDDVLFIVTRMVDLKRGAATEQISLFVGENFVLTLQEEAGDCWDPVRERIRKKMGRIRHVGPDYLAYALLDASIDSYFPVLEAYGERIDVLEDDVLLRPDRTTIDQIHQIKSELLVVRRAIWPHREAIAHLSRDSTPLISDSTRVYLRDCYDHVVQIVDLVETYRELTADLKDLYMSAVSNRINETMRVLTIVSTIFIPITFIAGIYGMNFDPSSSPFNMPELRWYFGYPLALAMMAATAGGMLFYFRWQGWIGGGRPRAALNESGARETNGSGNSVNR